MFLIAVFCKASPDELERITKVLGIMVASGGGPTAKLLRRSNASSDLSQALVPICDAIVPIEYKDETVGIDTTNLEAEVAKLLAIDFEVACFLIQAFKSNNFKKSCLRDWSLKMSSL